MQVDARLDRKLHKSGQQLAIEVRDTFHHPALFFFGKFGEHGQGQYFFCGALGLGKVAFAVSEINETGLQVQRDGIVDLSPDPARGEKLAQFLAAVGPDDVLMKNMISVPTVSGS